MIKATFAIPAAEFNAEWLEKIRPFLLDVETEVIVQVRRKTKRVRKNGSAPAAPLDDLNGHAAQLPALAKRYLYEPSPEEAQKMLTLLTSRSNSHPLIDLDEQVFLRTNNPPNEARVLEIIREMDVQEPIEELLAKLTA